MRRITKSKGARPSQQKPGKKHASAKHASSSGQLVAVTATGPIYLDEMILEVAPTKVGLAFIQELAARVIDPRTKVVSTRAKAVGGSAAYAEWCRTCGLVSGWLLSSTPTRRVEYLSEVLDYVRANRNVEGIEPIVGAALNAVWPWIEGAAFARILARMAAYIRKSAFAAANAIPIVDVHTRTMTFFAPGELAKIDITEWLDLRALAKGMAGLGKSGAGASDYAPPGGGSYSDAIIAKLLGPGTPGHGLDLSGLPGPHGERGNGDSFESEAIRRLLGGRGSSTSGLPSPGSQSRSEDSLGEELIKGLIGDRGPDAGTFAGPGDSRRNQDEFGSDVLSSLLGPGAVGHKGLDLSNVRGNGGPYGFGSALGPGGAEILPEAVVVAGIVVAIVVIAIGSYMYGESHNYHKPDTKVEPERPPPPVDTLPPPKEEKPPPTKDEKPPPKTEDPKNDGKKNHYPAGDNDNGPGHPLWIWDRDGHGGGNPTTIWDDDDEGNPTTLPDNDDDGVNPVTVADQITTKTLVGRGLLARVTQLGPRTFAL